MTTQIDEPATEKAIIRSLMSRRFPKHFCLPNYSPWQWWECDLFTITPAGYWWEFEVKLSLADFRADAKKTQQVPGTAWEFGKSRPMEMKHDVLAASGRGPARFHYVAPVGVIPVEMVPAWAGLIELNQVGKAYYERVVVEAPVRHKNKVDDSVRRQALETCYWRMHRML